MRLRIAERCGTAAARSRAAAWLASLSQEELIDLTELVLTSPGADVRDWIEWHGGNRRVAKLLYLERHRK